MCRRETLGRWSDRGHRPVQAADVPNTFSTDLSTFRVPNFKMARQPRKITMILHERLAISGLVEIVVSYDLTGRKVSRLMWGVVWEWELVWRGAGWTSRCLRRCVDGEVLGGRVWKAAYCFTAKNIMPRKRNVRALVRTGSTTSSSGGSSRRVSCTSVSRSCSPTSGCANFSQPSVNAWTEGRLAHTWTSTGAEWKWEHELAHAVHAAGA